MATYIIPLWLPIFFWEPTHQQNVWSLCLRTVVTFTEMQCFEWVQAHAEMDPICSRVLECLGGDRWTGWSLRRSWRVKLGGMVGQSWGDGRARGLRQATLVELFWLSCDCWCQITILLILMVMPLQILESTTSLKIVRKVHEALRHIMAGLIFNSDMNAESLLLLSHGLISENLPLLTEKAKWVPRGYPAALLSLGGLLAALKPNGWPSIHLPLLCGVSKQFGQPEGEGKAWKFVLSCTSGNLCL